MTSSPSNSGDRFALVIHANLHAPDIPARPAGSPALYIFWRDHRPVAQLWLGREDGDAKLGAFAASICAEPPAPPSKSLPSASVIICTRDRPEELARCLASLPNQSRPPNEVIVVDNASSDDRTRNAAQRAGVSYVREDRPGLDFARNAGLQAATSEIVAYTDDDTELHPYWLQHLLQAFDSEEVMAVTGLVLPASLDTEAQWLFESEWGFGRGYSRLDFGPEFYRGTRNKGCPAWEVGAGANMAFRKSVFDLVGEFDERLDVGAAGCSGDSEMWYRILAAGWTCRYEPSAVVFHHHRRAMESLEQQIYYYLRGHVAALMVQFERTGDLGNLYRAFVTLPYHYVRSGVGRIIRGVRPGNRLLRSQVLGAISGLLFYFRTRRPRARPGS